MIEPLVGSLQDVVVPLSKLCCYGFFFFLASDLAFVFLFEGPQPHRCQYLPHPLRFLRICGFVTSFSWALLE